MPDETSQRPTRAPFPPLDLLHGLADALRQGRIGTGEAAALRRLDPLDPDRRHILPLMRLLAATEIDDTPGTWRRLALIANAVALARGLHDPQMEAGRGLHSMNFSEQRLMALLAADFATLADLLPRIARRAAAAGVAMDWRPLALLAWFVDRDDARADAERRKIASAGLRAAAPPNAA